MSKETILTKPGRVLNFRTVIFSDWQVDEAIQIPVRRELVPPWAQRPQKRASCQKNSFKRRFALLVALMLGLAAGISAKAAQSVSIAWNASTDPTTVGYIVYAGSSPSNYTAQLNVGTNTQVTVTGLKEGSTNYFAVSAYNAANVIGSPSTAVSYIVPGKVLMSSASGTRTLSFPTASGHWYEVDASTDLKTWTNIYQTSTATNNAWINYTDPRAGSFPHRFYRLTMH